MMMRKNAKDLRKYCAAAAAAAAVADDDDDDDRLLLFLVLFVCCLGVPGTTPRGTVLPHTPAQMPRRRRRR